MNRRVFHCAGGDIVLPAPGAALVSAEDGGNLIVEPPRVVWERSELEPAELTFWAFLVAASGRAMLDTLPQLEGGCINYWEAGNWALNDAAEPRGPKTPRLHRRVHLHLLGRSRTTKNPACRWGEAPHFPEFSERHSWAQTFRRLSALECRNIVTRAASLLRERYGMSTGQIDPWSPCRTCQVPAPDEDLTTNGLCSECRT